MNTIKTFTNGNREIEIYKSGDKFYVRSNVFDGVKWQVGHSKKYQTLSNAERAAKKQVSEISTGWTKFPTWDVKEFAAQLA